METGRAIYLLTEDEMNTYSIDTSRHATWLGYCGWRLHGVGFTSHDRQLDGQARVAVSLAQLAEQVMEGRPALSVQYITTPNASARDEGAQLAIHVMLRLRGWGDDPNRLRDAVVISAEVLERTFEKALPWCIFEPLDSIEAIQRALSPWPCVDLVEMRPQRMPLASGGSVPSVYAGIFDADSFADDLRRFRGRAMLSWQIEPVLVDGMLRADFAAAEREARAMLNGVGFSCDDHCVFPGTGMIPVALEQLMNLYGASADSTWISTRIAALRHLPFRLRIYLASADQSLSRALCGQLAEELGGVGRSTIRYAWLNPAYTLASPAQWFRPPSAARRDDFPRVRHQLAYLLFGQLTEQSSRHVLPADLLSALTVLEGLADFGEVTRLFPLPGSEEYLL